MSKPLQQQEHNIIHWTDIFFQSDTGYINATNLKGYGRWYGSNDIERLINDTQGKYKQYLSINSFGVDPKTNIPRRTKNNLKQIRNIAIDIDQYTKNLSIEHVLDTVQALVLDNEIPEPNMVATSRGVQLFYKIENGASPKMEWLTHIITCRLTERLQHVGADNKATDSTRLMRVPDSVNQRNGATVTWDIWNDQPYSLDVLRTYTELDKYKPAKVADVKAEVINFKHIKSRNDFFYRTNHARIRDLEHLFELRSGLFTNLRNEFVYIYAYHYSLIYNTENAVLDNVNALIANIESNERDPFNAKEVKNTVKSAYEGAKRFLDKYKQDNHTIKYANDGIVRPMRTSTVIDKLNITRDEQAALNRLYSPDMKRTKEAERVRKYYGLKGTRTEYNKKRSADKADMMKQIRELKSQSMTNKQIANILNKSVSTVQRLNREAKNND